MFIVVEQELCFATV